MKKWVLILSFLFAFSTNAKAEIYHDIDVDLVYKNGNFNSKEEVKTLIDNYLQRDITENDENKTTVSNMIDNHYHNPEYIPVMEAKCQESMEWIKGNFALWEEPNFRADMCLTWEINKKLTNEQIETFAHLKKAWENVISDLHQKYDFDASYNRAMEYSLQLAVRFYNLVLHQDWPECLYETNQDMNYYINQYDNKPCNIVSPALKECRNNKNVISCMQTQIITLMSKLVTEQYREQSLIDVKNLLDFTEKVITEILKNPLQQQKEIIKLYNFYWLSIQYAYDVISLFTRTSI